MAIPQPPSRAYKFEEYANTQLDHLLIKLGHGRGSGRVMFRARLRFSAKILASKDVQAWAYEEVVKADPKMANDPFWSKKHLYLDVGPVFLNLPWPLWKKNA